MPIKTCEWLYGFCGFLYFVLVSWEISFSIQRFSFFVAGMMNGSTLSIRKHRLFLWTHAVSL